MKTSLDLSMLQRAKVGWNLCHKLIDHLGRIESNITVVYSFETKELYITDGSLVGMLDFLDIPYNLVEPSQTVLFVKGD